ncbi:serine hydrolase [Acidisoma sp. S159]|jgi:CubicO group peptidase (beta-lactamase class C family)|uniref:serine hydrolase n=1 Tax=Acidisoma sp. S159 TaxID=1747225 RepID=UPI00131C457B|nr:serine hydrolase [Acidisoma sp. S159]
MIVALGKNASEATQKPRPSRSASISVLLMGLVLGSPALVNQAWAADDPATQPTIEARVQAMVPNVEAYATNGMKSFDCPGLAIGIVVDDKLIYAKGFGVRSKIGGVPVDSQTLFQIGSATKSFLATTLALMVDRGKLHWDDRVTDLDPEFQLKDAWVTREFRVFDLLAQRSGLPPYANDGLSFLGLDETALIHSLRYVEPVSSFRSTFAYTNITHLLAGRIVAKAAGAADWNAVLQKELLDPLTMSDTSYTAAAMERASNHAAGYRWTPQGTVEVPFTQIFPYSYDGAGDINSNVEDMSRWIRFQLGHGAFAGRSIVSPENLAVTHTPKVAITEKISYAMGWIIQQTTNGTVVWHNGGTPSFGAFMGLAPDRNVGVIVLSNEGNVGFPDGLGAWILDRVLGNPETDYLAATIKRATASYDKDAQQFANPLTPAPSPPLAPLVGSFANPGIGKVMVSMEGDGLVMELAATGAKLRLAPWNGDVFTASLMPTGQFAALVANSGPSPAGFVQFQADKTAKLDVLHLLLTDSQAYDFQRE